MFNSQFSILIRKEKPPHVCEPACKTNDPCCDEHWELSIGQILSRIQGSGFCQVIFARALSMVCATATNARFKPRFAACV